MSVRKITMAPGGPEFSAIVSGMWRLADWNLLPREILSLIERSLELGISTFDHADIYGGHKCEVLFGEAIALKPSIRNKIELVTKCSIVNIAPASGTVKHYNTSTDHIITSVNNSLKNFNTTYIDLLLIHRPDPLMNADEIAEAFNYLKQSGAVLHFGVSNFNPSQAELIQSRLDFQLVTNQVEFSLLETAPIYNGVFDYCQRQRIRPMAWSPFGGGKLFTPGDEKGRRVNAAINHLAEKYSSTFDRIALAWILKHPSGVIPVIGTGKIDRIENAAESSNINLSRDDWFYLLKASSGTDVP